MTATVYPTGTTIYDPHKCWNGYTLFQATLHQAGGAGAVLTDMNGNVVNQWRGLDGFPNKLLPGGHVMGSTGARDRRYGYQDMLDLVQADWDGHIVWKFDRYERVKDPRRKARWMARQHHDYQREGNPVGYYVPGLEPRVEGGRTLLLCHKNLTDPRISDKPLVDDTIIEIDADGKIEWEWTCSEHFDEMGFSEESRNAMSRDPGLKPSGGGVGDWMHVNSMSTLGPNRHFDAGDDRFHPDNIIWDGRQTNITGITDKKTGKIVWQLGPDFTATPALRAMGQIIGQHHAHLVPRGLPGEGNVLVFDNGGWAGYGAPNPGAPTGLDNARRDYSRVLEFDPMTLEILWQYPKPRKEGAGPGGNRFYSSFVSSAQRLPNGNTLITEGNGGRILEVTPERETVWEYLSPYRHRRLKIPLLYRAYRVPYDWAPQADRPEEKAIPRLDNRRFRVPGSPRQKPPRVTTVKGGVSRGV
ncbi:MAG TPA: aryl-sulfate sulfotransferase [Dehalococcoidales bacterium]|nr:aryl-sulfate sulfotransferase [Dehalococcoidales bacterium]